MTAWPLTAALAPGTALGALGFLVGMGSEAWVLQEGHIAVEMDPGFVTHM